MNKRISQLIKQSYVTIRTPSGEESTYFSQEKFAELIVKMCADRCEQSPYPHPNYSVAIKKHFGVEE